MIGSRRSIGKAGSRSGASHCYASGQEALRLYEAKFAENRDGSYKGRLPEMTDEENRLPDSEQSASQKAHFVAAVLAKTYLVPGYERSLG